MIFDKNLMAEMFNCAIRMWIPNEDIVTEQGNYLFDDKMHENNLFYVINWQ